MKSVVKGLCIQEHAQAISFPDLCPLLDCPVVFSKHLAPVWNLIQVVIECQLGLDNGADPVVGAEVIVEVGSVTPTLFHPIAGLYHKEIHNSPIYDECQTQ